MALNVIVNEVLCFVQNNYIKGNRNELSATIVMFYTTDDVVNAKNCLFTVANGLQIEELPRQVVRKAGENKRRLDTEDLLQLYGVLDVNKVVLPIYVAADLARIPPPVNSAQFEVKRLSSSVDELRSQLSAI